MPRAKCILVTFWWLPSTSLISNGTDYRDRLYARQTNAVSRLKPRLQWTQIQTHPRQELLHPHEEEGHWPQRGPATGRGARQPKGLLPQSVLHGCSTHGIRIIKMPWELFLYRIDKCMVEKTVRLSLDQWFSKGGPWTCFHHLETRWKWWGSSWEAETQGGARQPVF